MREIPRVLLLLETGNEYGLGLARGIARYARLQGPWSFYRLPPFYRTKSARNKKLHLPLREKFDADGIIAHVNNPIHAEEILNSGIPAIVTYVFEPIPGLINIKSDSMAIGRLGAEHLLERRFIHFAYCGYDDAAWSRHRAESFSMRLTEAGFSTYLYHQPGSARKRVWENEQLIMAKWICSLPKPVAIMACNDARAQYISEVCKTAGFSVPEQVAILGVDNDAVICDLSDPPLSSIPLNTERAGYEAAECLDRMMRGGPPDIDLVRVHPEPVVVRQSTDITAINDEVVAASLRYIRLYADQIQGVEDVAKTVHLSLRQLQKRFRKAIGVQINEEIRRVRMQKVARLLIETTMPISKIAYEVGFESPKSIARCFLSEMGASLSEYRKNYGKKS
ncbi:MAG: XylR family transcriptional regulator [Planctomycetota bacterium]|nr:XylR family transcriptional regulator [Planctomycetota bacterium]